ARAAARPGRDGRAIAPAGVLRTADRGKARAATRADDHPRALRRRAGEAARGADRPRARRARSVGAAPSRPARASLGLTGTPLPIARAGAAARRTDARSRGVARARAR